MSSFAQVDTLVVNFGENYEEANCNLWEVVEYGESSCLLKNELVNYSKHKLFITTYSLPPLDKRDINCQKLYKNKKVKNHAKKLRVLLDVRLPKIKVLIVINPLGLYQQTTKEDTLQAPIYKLHFKNMTSLQEVYLFGDDSDRILEMPKEFYSTPVKTVYCGNLEDFDLLRNNIQRRRKDINVIQCDNCYLPLHLERIKK